MERTSEGILPARVPGGGSHVGGESGETAVAAEEQSGQLGTRCLGERLPRPAQTLVVAASSGECTAGRQGLGHGHHLHHIATDEGWLCLAGIKDLSRSGYALDARMTQQ